MLSIFSLKLHEGNLSFQVAITIFAICDRISSFQIPEFSNTCHCPVGLTASLQSGLSEQFSSWQDCTHSHQGKLTEHIAPSLPMGCYSITPPSSTALRHLPIERYSITPPSINTRKRQEQEGDQQKLSKPSPPKL